MKNYIARVRETESNHERGHAWGMSARSAIIAAKRRFPDWRTGRIVVEYFNCTKTSCFDTVTLSEADQKLLK